MFVSELAPAAGTVPLVNEGFTSSVGYWGIPAHSSLKRILLPQAQQRCAYLRVGFEIAEVGALWQLNGISLAFEPMSERSQ